MSLRSTGVLPLACQPKKLSVQKAGLDMLTPEKHKVTEVGWM